MRDDQADMPWGMTICGIDELEGHCELRASHVLSILDPDWPVPEAFGTWGEHRKLELRFNDVVDPQPGMIAPAERDVAALLGFGRDLADVSHLVVHCHAGISRSTASMSLILAQLHPERPAEAVLAHILAIRQKAWPNIRMIELGDALLGRDGALVAATHRLHRLQIDRRPELAEFMAASGRAREVEAASGVAPLLVAG